MRQYRKYVQNVAALVQDVNREEASLPQLNDRYRAMLIDLTKLMEVDFHEPDELVIEQNDDVSVQGKFLKDMGVYFFLDGVYVRLTLQFDPRLSLSR